MELSKIVTPEAVNLNEVKDLKINSRLKNNLIQRFCFLAAKRHKIHKKMTGFFALFALSCGQIN
jgi:hypothetical protein